MLEPEGGGFRFLDLPAELRTLVYSFMLEDNEPVEMSTTKRANHPRRPVRKGYFYKSSGRKRHAEVDQSSGVVSLVRMSSPVYSLR